MKRILYIGGFELPDKNAAAHRVLAIAKALRDGGIEVIFFGVSKSNNERDVLRTKTEVQGFISYSVPYPKEKKEWVEYLISPKSAKTLIEEYGSIDGVICYNYQAVAFNHLRKYCKTRGIKIYSDCTEWYNTEGASIAFKVLKGFDTWYRMTIVQKKLDGLLVISNYLKKYYSSCKNVIVVPPLVDCKEQKWDIPEKELGTSVNFVYAGKPGNKDKIGEIVAAFCNLIKNYDCRLLVVGISKEQFLQANPEADAENIPNEIVFLGRVSHAQSIAYLKGSDCSLIIRDSTRTNNAGFPTKFVEAVTLGVGVIATDISDLAVYADKLDNVLLVNGSLYKTMEHFVLTNSKNKNPSYMFDYREWIDMIDSFFAFKILI